MKILSITDLRLSFHHNFEIISDIMNKSLSVNRLSALVILWIIFSFQLAATSPKNDTLTFIHVTDPHVCNLTGYNTFFVEKRQHFGKNIQTFPGFLKSVPEKYEADFVVVTGDNIDYYEAETDNGGMLDTQVEQYSRLLGQCNLPVYITLGNHDISTYSINKVPAVTSNQLYAERARATWMRNVACFKEGTYYSHLFNLESATIRLIFLDNGYYSTEEMDDGVLPFVIDPFQLKWLDAQLKASDTDIEIIFMHIPLPYGNSAGNSILTEPITSYSSKTNSFNLLNILEKNSSSRLIFAGHKHINLINNYKLKDKNILTQVMTGAFGYDTANFRVIKITKDNILISMPGSSKIEYTIPVR